MAFKIKDGIRIGTTDVFNNTGTLLVNAPTASKVNNALSAGTGLTGGPYDGSAAITISHADTSSAANLTASGRTYVTGLTFDTFGHVTGYTTGAETVTDTNTTYSLDGSGTTNSVNIELIAGGSGSGTDSINVVGSGAATVAWDEANQRITISSTDTNTTYSHEAVTTTGGALLRLASSGGVNDDIKLASGTNVTVAYTDANTITISAAQPTVNNAGLTVSVAEDGTTGNSVYITTGTGFTANSSTAATYDVHVGPALKNLADTMTGAATTGLLKKTGEDTYALDTTAYYSASNPPPAPAETDTLQTVTVRGATTNVATVSLTATTASTSTGTGALVVAGGVGIGGNAYVGGNVVITGNLTVDGTTTTVNSTTITVDDKNIELGSVATPSNTTADGGGITLKGTTDKTFNWLNATAAWTSSEHIALAAGKDLLMNGATSGTITVVVPDVAGTNTITLPAATGTVALTSQIPTVNSAGLTVTVAEDGTTGNSVYITTGTGFTANSSTAATYDVHVGPALKNLADTMTGATTGFLKKTAADTYTLDTNTYLTSQSTDFKTVTITDADSGYTWADNGSAVADVVGDTLTIVSGNGVEIEVDATNDALRIRSQGSEHAFSQATSVLVATPVAGTAYTLDTWAKGSFRAAKYVITATQGTFYQSSEIMVFNDGTTAGQLTEYAVFSTAPASELTYTIDASGTDMILKASTPTATTALTFKIHRIINLV